MIEKLNYLLNFEIIFFTKPPLSMQEKKKHPKIVDLLFKGPIKAKPEGE